MIAEMGALELVEPKPKLASMRPRSDDRGNHSGLGAADLVDQASMRPRSDDRGNEKNHEHHGSRQPASMRPRSDDRGNHPPRRHGEWRTRSFNEAAIR